MHDPFPWGSNTDINNFREGLKILLRKNEYVITDKGYRAENVLKRYRMKNSMNYWKPWELAMKLSTECKNVSMFYLVIFGKTNQAWGLISWMLSHNTFEDQAWSYSRILYFYSCWWSSLILLWSFLCMFLRNVCSYVMIGNDIENFEWNPWQNLHHLFYNIVPSKFFYC